MDVPFEYIPHTSEFQLKIYGKTLKELFANALYAFAKTIKENLPFKATQEREIKLKAENLELLLAGFLQEVVYLVDVHSEVYIDIKFNKLSATELSAVLKGAKVDEFDEEIKGVAYDGLKISKEGDVFVAEVVLDV